MDRRPLGKSGVAIRPVAFGGNVFGWTADETLSFRLLDQFVDAGFSLVDTADAYCFWEGKPGISEEIIGKWIRSRRKRSQIVLATKVGMEAIPGCKGLAREHIRWSVEESLRRLSTDYIDLYQAHIDDSDTPLEETLGEFSRLVEEGKVRSIGASNYKAARLKEALSVSREGGMAEYVTLQPLYNLYDRQPFEEDLLQLCLDEQIGVITYFSLASGFLSGKYRSEADLAKSARGPRAARYLDERGFRILTALDGISTESGASLSQIALAWLLSRPGISAPIVSASNEIQLDEILDSVNLVLSQEHKRRLEEASSTQGSACP